MPTDLLLTMHLFSAQRLLSQQVLALVLAFRAAVMMRMMIRLLLDQQPQTISMAVVETTQSTAVVATTQLMPVPGTTQ